MALGGQTSTRHKFGDLLGSDNFIFNISSPGGNYTNLGLDLLNGTASAWTSGQTGKDGSKLPGETIIQDAMTSLEWNLENSGWTDLTHSPAYNYNQISGKEWEWNIIYEFSIPKNKLGNQCGTVGLVSAHTSPGVYVDSLATIGDRVWADANENGAQDSGEVGLSGVVVNLYQGTTLVRTTQTAPGLSGYYIFNNLPAGTYTVNVDESTLPSGWALTTANEPKTVTVTAGQKFETADFGYWETGTASIGDRVWYDLDGDGTQDAGEPGINGMTVNLYEGACGAGGPLQGVARHRRRRRVPLRQTAGRRLLRGRGRQFATCGLYAHLGERAAGCVARQRPGISHGRLWLPGALSGRHAQRSQHAERGGLDRHDAV